jgi:hypothetical protein
MAGTFGRRMDDLKEIVGDGPLEGTVVVDQIYARYQHEGLDLKHPRGGQAKFLSQPLLDNRDGYLTEIAKTVLEDGGKQGMESAVEDLAGEGGVETHAPVLWGDLRRSGHPTVRNNGAVVFDRPPAARRLTETELKDKARRIPLPGPLLGYIWWHVEHHAHPPNYHGGA